MWRGRPEPIGRFLPEQMLLFRKKKKPEGTLYILKHFVPKAETEETANKIKFVFYTGCVWNSINK